MAFGRNINRVCWQLLSREETQKAHAKVGATFLTLSSAEIGTPLETELIQEDEPRKLCMATTMRDIQTAKVREIPLSIAVDCDGFKEHSRWLFF